MKIKSYFKNDFKIWHAVFVSLYLTTYLVGFFRTSNTFFYKIHPYLGISTFILPLIVFLLSKQKKLIIQMIKSNFTLKGSNIIKTAKISTILIILSYITSVVTGLIVNYELYNTYDGYLLLRNIHGFSKYLLPIFVVIHVYSRLKIKSKKKR
jgi:cytochrome b561